MFEIVPQDSSGRQIYARAMIYSRVDLPVVSTHVKTVSDLKRINRHRKVAEQVVRLVLFVLQQEVSEVPLTLPSESLTNGDLEGDEAAEVDDLETPVATIMGPPLVSTASGGAAVVSETLEPETDAVEGRAAALVAAARAVVSEDQLKRRLASGGHPCAQCDRVFMSMQGLRSHERSHSAMALFSREDKYSCQYCQFVSPFRHK